MTPHNVTVNECQQRTTLPQSTGEVSEYNPRGQSGLPPTVQSPSDSQLPPTSQSRTTSVSRSPHRIRHPVIAGDTRDGPAKRFIDVSNCRICPCFSRFVPLRFTDLIQTTLVRFLAPIIIAASCDRSISRTHVNTTSINPVNEFPPLV